MTSLEYIAGFFDGEGSAGLYASSSSGRYNLRAAVNQVKTPESEFFFRELAQRFGGKTYAIKRQREHHRTAISWGVYGNAAAEFLRSIGPHVVLKKDQIKAFLGWHDTYGSDRHRKKNPALAAEKANAARFVMEELRPKRSKGPKPKSRKLVLALEGVA